MPTSLAFTSLQAEDFARAARERIEARLALVPPQDRVAFWHAVGLIYFRGQPGDFVYQPSPFPVTPQLRHRVH